MTGIIGRFRPVTGPAGRRARRPGPARPSATAASVPWRATNDRPTMGTATATVAADPIPAFGSMTSPKASPSGIAGPQNTVAPRVRRRGPRRRGGERQLPSPTGAERRTIPAITTAANAQPRGRSHAHGTDQHGRAEHGLRAAERAQLDRVPSQRADAQGAGDARRSPHRSPRPKRGRGTRPGRTRSAPVPPPRR